MARGRDPALPLYADEFTRDTRVQSLPRELRGPLVHLWCIAWMEGPLQDARVRGIARLIDATEDETRLLLGEFFARTKDGWVSRRLEEERADRAAYRKKQQESGKAGAARRWGRHSDPNGDPSGARPLGSHGSRTHTHTQGTHTEGSPSSSPPEESGTSDVRSKRARA